MVTIHPFRPLSENESYRYGFVVKGHANYAEHGKDIVCSAISAITQTAILGLDYYNGVTQKSKDGFLSVEIYKDDHTTDAIMKTMLLGLEEIEKQYPKYLQIKKTGETM